MNVREIIRENKQRWKVLNEPYDPITGLGSPLERQTAEFLYRGAEARFDLPIQMMNEPVVQTMLEHGSVESFVSSLNMGMDADQFMKSFHSKRCFHDFEYWAFTEVTINDKNTGHPIAFKLNRPQRKLLGKLIEKWLSGESIQVIIVKARQWGGSTLVQIFMNWIQLVHRKGWNSLIMADLKDQARNIRNFQTDLIENYSLADLSIKNFEGSSNTKYIPERDCVISVGSMQKPNSARSADIKMAHLSEVGEWVETEGRKPDEVVSSVRGTIKGLPGTVEVLESTAKGIGNFFHQEYLNALKPDSTFIPFFVGWHEDPRNNKPVNNYKEFISSWDDYEWSLWERGATIEGIQWYRTILASEYRGDLWRMNSNNPTDVDEAFQATGVRFLPMKYIVQQEKMVREPEKIGDFTPSVNLEENCTKDIRFEEQANGRGFMWTNVDKQVNMPNRYLVIYDVGGKSDKADWNVITVIDRYWVSLGDRLEVIFRWRGHIEPDLGAWKAMQIAYYYNKALLVIESNYFETKAEQDSGDHSLTVIDIIANHYKGEVYTRTRPEKIKDGLPIQYGFHMNKQTKPLAYDKLLTYVRNSGIVEPDIRAINEMKTLEEDRRGRINAVEGCHDDITDTDAIGIYIHEEEMSPPKEVPANRKWNTSREAHSEASI